MKKISFLLFAVSIAITAFTQNVGIGTNTPAFKLDVNGRMRVKTGTLGNVSTSSGIWFEDYRNGDNRFFFGMRDSILAGFYGGGQRDIGWDFLFNATNGNVGIGTLPADEVKLKVHSDGDGTPVEASGGTDLPGISAFINNNNPGIGFNLRIGKSGFGNPIEEYIGNGYGALLEYSPSDGKMLFNQTVLSGSPNTTVIVTSPSMAIDNAGNIGVGTSFPAAKLHVNGSSNELVRLSGTQPGIRFVEGGTEDGFIDVATNDLRIGTLASNNTGKFLVRVNGGDRLIVLPNGNIGIGEGNPGTRLHVTGGEDEIFRLDGINPMMRFAQSGTVRGFMAIVGNDTKIGTLSDNNTGRFVVRVNGGDRMFVHPNGFVSIGTATPATNYLLSVNGRVICSELKVQLSSNWPDYVFNEKYRLKSFDELRKYIADNNHLPNIPSAAEIEKNGIEVGDMQKRMMEKIEELTLYVLQLEEKISRLKHESIKK